ncbi:hypothetical protein A2334_01240 [Candidatus Roizmanbacteria bacterium RIFOXYB2_FULL_38_10]|uniref:Uncharacterized protein n=1 Tax=Candidatus Roizmanbacteria bacterium RIFOXYD1_FULL_38_12 TaxID=1802093 RepID=A0A1F7L1N0_9BACT|nr:MAG: hypothetical protein A3K47_04535 [Candidatus Roizmanbacteria bacterium RIFOXYA2_FULL_38_14]OGK64018.1 MAG: hypothetical protein A3K27_04535 [Candidatus Roizmanbacteria bacterium RIFOXYA1_FULL_37_12]OGK65864.1 MAG: hypothetical protein A3K38_04535 [Candidatus Roizmanbacteria bacterium RIFOXYB1_FULL_40_23]OGK68971.1 MAG: hypothetical protein A2334_01240 [Candidatus Roizmanbacteria bacterium RIFOXYB2_FULL_38_10]OGK70269.1 MAG: hypothetical protein A3K21_04540 [Candidatus Roizmanbacteria ba
MHPSTKLCLPKSTLMGILIISILVSIVLVYRYFSSYTLSVKSRAEGPYCYMGTSAPSAYPSLQQCRICTTSDLSKCNAGEACVVQTVIYTSTNNTPNMYVCEIKESGVPTVTDTSTSLPIITLTPTPSVNPTSSILFSYPTIPSNNINQNTNLLPQPGTKGGPCIGDKLQIYEISNNNPAGKPSWSYANNAGRIYVCNAPYVCVNDSVIFQKLNDEQQTYRYIQGSRICGVPKIFLLKEGEMWGRTGYINASSFYGNNSNKYNSYFDNYIEAILGSEVDHTNVREPYTISTSTKLKLETVTNISIGVNDNYEYQISCDYPRSSFNTSIEPYNYKIFECTYSTVGQRTIVIKVKQWGSSDIVYELHVPVNVISNRIKENVEVR